MKNKESWVLIVREGKCLFSTTVYYASLEASNSLIFTLHYRNGYVPTTISILIREKELAAEQNLATPFPFSRLHDCCSPSTMIFEQTRMLWYGMLGRKGWGHLSKGLYCHSRCQILFWQPHNIDDGVWFVIGCPCDFALKCRSRI